VVQKTISAFNYMNNFLSKYLKKQGIKNVDEMEPEEQKVFEQWQAVLNKEELTIADFKAFCQSQVDVIEAKWRDLSLANAKKAELIPYHTVYKTLLGVIAGPVAARETLEAHLQQLIDQ
jgi:hypothetical protein